MNISVMSFNVEDFTVQPFRPVFCKNMDIIMVQEWNFEKGSLFMKFLGKKYKVVFFDRVAVIFNKTKFFDSEIHPIQLKYEDPTAFEKLYTTGRLKHNILTILKMKEGAIAVINCHLSAFIIDSYPHFHKRQMTDLFRKASTIIRSFEKQHRQKCEVIVGGDTNYRKGVETDLLNELIPKHPKALKDVCDNMGCEKTATQSFRCVHEKTVDKRIVKRYFSLNKMSKDENARIDMIATTMMVLDAKLIPACEYSDHSAIRCILSKNSQKKTRKKMYKN